MSRSRIALLSDSPIEWSPEMADYDPPLLADIWASLGVDERLSIALERFTADIRGRAKLLEGMDDLARARLVGYTNAIADVMHYVVEGQPMPEPHE